MAEMILAEQKRVLFLAGFCLTPGLFMPLSAGSESLPY